MMSYYFDSSALVKGYVAETGSDWISQIISNANNTIYIASISFDITDAQLAIAHLKVDFRTYYQVLEVTQLIISSAMVLAERHHLSGYQSVQLATAFALQVRRGFLWPCSSFRPLVQPTDTGINARAT